MFRALALAPLVALTACAQAPVRPSVASNQPKPAPAPPAAPLPAVETPDAQGHLPLHEAAARGDIAAVDACLAQGANPNRLDGIGAPALLGAAKFGHLNVIGRLIRAGAQVDLPSSMDGFTPLMAAAAEHQVDAVRLLLDHGAVVSARNAVDGTTALHWAVYASRPEEIHSYRTISGPHETIYVARKDAPLVDLLLARGAPVNVAEKDGETPLHRAVMFGALPATTALLAAGADPTLRDREGQTALDLARARVAQAGGWNVHDKRTQIMKLLENARR